MADLQWVSRKSVMARKEGFFGVLKYWIHGVHSCKFIICKFSCEICTVKANHKLSVFSFVESFLFWEKETALFFTIHINVTKRCCFFFFFCEDLEIVVGDQK